MIFEHTHISSFLASELKRRVESNPRYSSNSFARDLKVSSAYLSLLMQQKRKLSMKTADQMATRLNLSPKEQEFFLLLAQREASPSVELQDYYTKQSQKLLNDIQITDLTLEKFRLLSDWYHSVILESFELSTPPCRAEEISSRFGVEQKDVEASIKLLEKLGLLKREQGKLKRLSGRYLSTPNDMASSALRQFHTQVLQMAIVALEEQPVESRHISGLTLAIDPEKIPLAKKKIRQFIRTLSAELAGGEKKEIYQLSVSFFKPHRNLFRSKK